MSCRCWFLRQRVKSRAHQAGHLKNFPTTVHLPEGQWERIRITFQHDVGNGMHRRKTWLNWARHERNVLLIFVKKYLYDWNRFWKVVNVKRCVYVVRFWTHCSIVLFFFVRHQGGPYHDVLHSILGAYTCYRPDVGYVSHTCLTNITSRCDTHTCDWGMLQLHV